MTANQAEEQRVTARAQLYVDVIIDGRKTIYDVETAERLVKELTLALNHLDQLLEQAGGRTNPDRPLRKDDGLVRQSADVAPLVGAEGVRQGV